MPVVLLSVLLAGGLLSLGIILSWRWLEGWLWRRQLVAYRLELPRRLGHNQVSDWLAALGAATRHIPAMVEAIATRGGISHFLVVPQFHAKMLTTQLRNMLPGVQAEEAVDHLADEATIRAAGELRLTGTSHPLGDDRAAGASSALLSALQPLAEGQSIRISCELAGLLGLPLDDVQAPGLVRAGATQLPPTPDLPRRGLVLAYSNYSGLTNRPLTLQPADQLRHVYVLGPTGSGKSTNGAYTAIQNAASDDGMFFIDL